MRPSDFSSACMPIVRLLPSWAGPECWPDTDEIYQVPTKGHLHVHGVSDCARLQALCAGRMLLSGQQDGVSTSEFDPFPARGLPCERFKLSLAASPCITRGRRGWLGLTPWKTFTSYPLPAYLAHSGVGQTRM